MRLADHHSNRLRSAWEQRTSGPKLLGAAYCHRDDWDSTPQGEKRGTFAKRANFPVTRSSPLRIDAKESPFTEHVLRQSKRFEVSGATSNAKDSIDP